MEVQKISRATHLLLHVHVFCEVGTLFIEIVILHFEKKMAGCLLIELEMRCFKIDSILIWKVPGQVKQFFCPVRYDFGTKPFIITTKPY